MTNLTDPPLTLAFIGSFSIWHWMIVLAVVVVLFGGKGKISSIMRDTGIGITQFKKGLKEGEAEPQEAREIPESEQNDKSADKSA